MTVNRTTAWLKDRIPLPLKDYFRNFTVSRHRHSFWYYLGGFTLMCFVVQVITGLLLSFYYKPTLDKASESVNYIMNTVPFGGTVRSLHFWSANALMLGIFIHMFSSFFMRAYRKPREFVWITGAILLILVFFFAFTGHILPWDELAYSSARIGFAELERFPILGSSLSFILKGGREISEETLTRMFSIHTSVLPVLTILVLIVHLALTKLYGFSKSIGIKETKEPIKYYFDFKYRNAIVWLTGLGILIIFAVLLPHFSHSAFDINNIFEAPPGIHPEWYFMFIYQILKLDSIIPGSIILFIMSVIFLFWMFIPLIDNKANEEKNSKIFTITGIVIFAIILILTIWGVSDVIKFPKFFLPAGNENIAIGGLSGSFFLGTVLFLIFIMIMILVLKILNSETKQKAGKKN